MQEAAQHTFFDALCVSVMDGNDRSKVGVAWRENLNSQRAIMAVNDFNGVLLHTESRAASVRHEF